MQITPQAIQELLDELESSKQHRLRAWAVLQEFRTVLTGLGGVNLEAPSKKTFDAEGTTLREAPSRFSRHQTKHTSETGSWLPRVAR